MNRLTRFRVRHLAVVAVLAALLGLAPGLAAPALASSTCTCSLNVSTHEGLPGTSVTLTGAGFGASTSVTILFKDSSGTKTTLTTVTAGSTGSFSTTVTVPTTAPIGKSRFVAQDPTTSQSAGHVFWVWCASTPALGLNPTSGPPGTSVTVTGTGWCANTTVRLNFVSSTKVKTVLASSVAVDSTGSFTTTVTIPTSAPTGSSTINGVDTTTSQGTVTPFKVT